MLSAATKSHLKLGDVKLHEALRRVDHNWLWALYRANGPKIPRTWQLSQIASANREPSQDADIRSNGGAAAPDPTTAPAPGSLAHGGVESASICTAMAMQKSHQISKQGSIAVKSTQQYVFGTVCWCSTVRHQEMAFYFGPGTRTDYRPSGAGFCTMPQ